MNFKEIINNTPSFIKNKYFITTLIFAIWMLVFDQNDFISQLKLQRELFNLEDDKTYFLNEIEKTRNDLDELMSDNEKLEKFAREKYLMRKPNEEVFVIVKE